MWFNGITPAFGAWKLEVRILSRFQIIVKNKFSWLERHTYIQYELSLGQTLNDTIVLLAQYQTFNMMVMGLSPI